MTVIRQLCAAELSVISCTVNTYLHYHLTGRQIARGDPQRPPRSPFL